MVEISQNLQSIIIVYIYATFKYYNELKKIIEPEPDFITYRQALISKHESWYRQFVHVEANEEIYNEPEDINIYAIETDWDIKEEEPNTGDGKKLQ